MSNSDKRKNTPNFIENVEQAAKELFAYDDESLLREMKSAELEAEQQETEEVTDAGFSALMEKVRAQNLKPVSEREYSEKKAEESRKIVRLKRIKRVALVAALVGIMVAGMGFSVLAKRNFEYQYAKVGRTGNRTVWQNEEYVGKNDGLEDAYWEIGEKVGIKPVVLGYKPANVIFEQLTLVGGHAQLEFSCGNKALYFKQTSNPKDKVSDAITSDRKEIETVYNKNLNHDIRIEANDLGEEGTEYSASFEEEGTFYYLSGIIDKGTFIKIVKNLSYYQD